MKIRKHPNFTANYNQWQFYELAYDGGDKYTATKIGGSSISRGGELMLFNHRFESSSDYESRRKRSYYLNFVKAIVETYTKYTNGRALLRTAVDSAQEERYSSFAKNCDGEGTDLAVFMSRIASLTRVFGRVGVLIRGPEGGNEPKIITGVVSNSLLPRLTLIKPTQLLDWSRDRNSEFNWVFFSYEWSDDKNPNIERKSETRYQLWTRDSFSIFRRDKNKSEEEPLILVEEGENTWGVVPYVEFSHGRALGGEEPPSLISDISILARSVYNWCSLVDTIMYEQTFSQLVVGAEETEVNNQIMGVSKIWTYPKNTPFPPQYISPDASQAKLIMEWIHVGIQEMYRMATLPSRGANPNEVYATALGKEIDFEDTNAALSSAASLMEEGEMNLSASVSKFMGVKSGEGLWKAQYPKEFDPRSFSAELADAMSLEELRLGSHFSYLTKMKIAGRALPDASTSDMKTIGEEIKSLPELSIVLPPPHSTPEE